jgi:dTDP-4-dehydrorhamnose reductase
MADALTLALLGASGQVGTEWQRLLAQEVSEPIRLLAPAHDALDLADGDAVTAWVQTHRPQVIVNAAAYTAVDKAESDQEAARAVNATLPTLLAQWSKASGACLLHYSTDYVFDGSGTQPHREDDAVHPLSVYGRTKAEGEAGIRQHLDRHLILRTSWVMGAHGGNFLKTMLRLASERDQLRVVADQVGAPTPARLLAQMGWHALQWCRQSEAATPTQQRWGLYHLAPRGETSWCDYARLVLAEAKTRGWQLRAGPEDVTPITTADFPTPARRPANSRLDVSRFEQAFHITLPDWQEGVRATLDELRSLTS